MTAGGTRLLGLVPEWRHRLLRSIPETAELPEEILRLRA
jgi:hypothetical protein